MNIIITMAGKSQRFRDAGYELPKYLLSLGKKNVIQKVIECFAEEDVFHLVVSKSQTKKIKNLNTILLQLSKCVEVHVIDDHNYGPVYSVLSVLDKIPNEPFIINYCDFLVQWNYSKLKRLIADFDLVIPTFTGFHPANFGTTLFAYINSDKFGNLIELREKESFTSDRKNELASTGTYYFRDKNIFNKYANEVVNDRDRVLPEAYVSLLANPMVRDGLKVTTFNVDKFICLGTPYDYEEYIYWLKALNSKNNFQNDEFTNDVNIIPVAGQGSRFIDAGFKTPKPLLIFENNLLIEHSFASMPKSKRNIIISRLNNFHVSKLDKKMKEKLYDCHIINLDEMTNGQLDSCLAANKYLDRSDSILISSCDYSLHYDIKSWFDFKKSDDADIIIWTNKLKSTPVKDYEAFAYCLVNHKNNVTKIIEKKTISEKPWFDPMVVGTFWFKRWEIFLEMHNYVKTNGSFENAQENFIGTNINYLINRGYKVKCFWVDRWISYGDPFEYEMIHYWSDYFRPNSSYTS